MRVMPSMGAGTGRQLASSMLMTAEQSKARSNAMQQMHLAMKRQKIERIMAALIQARRQQEAEHEQKKAEKKQRFENTVLGGLKRGGLGALEAYYGQPATGRESLGMGHNMMNMMQPSGGATSAMQSLDLFDVARTVPFPM